MDLGYGFLGAGLGAGIAVFGAGFGIGRLAAAALDSMGRQPEAAGDLRTSMIIAAALIEGVAFFALVICMLLATKSGGGDAHAATEAFRALSAFHG